MCDSVYELSIECRDAGHVTCLVTTRNLTVRVMSAGSDVPVFTQSVYLATLIEHSALATSMLTVSATDRNTTRKAPVQYSLDNYADSQSFLLT